MVDCAEPLHLWGALDQPQAYDWYTNRKAGMVEMYRNYRWTRPQDPILSFDSIK